MNKGRNILHLDLDTFFVSVERLKNSALVGKPLLIGGLSDRSVVSSCSYETRKFGVRSGMPMKMARYLCPEATIVRGDFESYSNQSRIIAEIIGEKAPVFEQASIDEFYLDLTGMDKFVGCYKWSEELKRTIGKETGLPSSFGLSVNKTVSKIGTGEAKPNGQIEIPFRNVQPFLNPLAIKKIPGVGPETSRLLGTMGVKKIETLAKIPLEMIERLLGKNGITIWEKANGIDDSAVTPYVHRKSISHEETFDVDTTDVLFLQQILISAVEKLCFQLRQAKQLTGNLTVKIKYANFDTHSASSQLKYTSYDHILISQAKEIFNRLYDRRMLIRLLGVRFSKMVYGFQQIDLFEDSVGLGRLYLEMDQVKTKHGEDIIKRAKSLR
jgi:DNA polymerase IV